MSGENCLAACSACSALVRHSVGHHQTGCAHVGIPSYVTERDRRLPVCIPTLFGFHRWEREGFSIQGGGNNVKGVTIYFYLGWRPQGVLKEQCYYVTVQFDVYNLDRGGLAVRSIIKYLAPRTGFKSIFSREP